ncbi:TetR family transcriptional regulator [Nocardia sp. CDC159]|uniref:TetR family transcriptional regulator n=1 Tax=Nocardia pulmonis TaxID=2951408 RepID=A0A9X2E9G6_9NOCA|nr:MULTISPECIES: TetR family transcriptional regulator [Nocardia]MCM6776757.1 TetR family transcriptional regulator [Nocardia pulmonis]MCM6789094.1 TetR family transcriptional regulator [Nocardia sp. CDC159]
METTAEDRSAADKPDLRARRRAQTLDEIHRAAVSLSEQRGFDNVTVDEIAARAGVSPRTFFRYFPTKESAVLHDRWGFNQAIESVIATADAATLRPADIEAATEHVLGEVVDNPVAASGNAEEMARTFRVITLTPHLQAAMLTEWNARTQAAIESVEPGARLRLRLLLDINRVSVSAAVSEWIDARTAGADDADLPAIYRRLCTQVRTLYAQ